MTTDNREATWIAHQDTIIVGKRLESIPTGVDSISIGYGIPPAMDPDLDPTLIAIGGGVPPAMDPKLVNKQTTETQHDKTS